MKCAIVLCLLSIAALSIARPEEKYTDRYDNVNTKEILSNPRVLKPYVDCILDKGKCAPDAKELKSHIQDALETDCSKCTDIQKQRVREVIAHLINHEPAHWEELTAKYDPKKVYTVKYEKDLREIKA